MLNSFDKASKLSAISCDKRRVISFILAHFSYKVKLWMKAVVKSLFVFALNLGL